MYKVTFSEELTEAKYRFENMIIFSNRGLTGQCTR